MITGEIKNKIDKIWEVFWTGGITNPLTVIEQQGATRGWCFPRSKSLNLNC